MLKVKLQRESVEEKVQRESIENIYCQFITAETI